MNSLNAELYVTSVCIISAIHPFMSAYNAQSIFLIFLIGLSVFLKQISTLLIIQECQTDYKIPILSLIQTSDYVIDCVLFLRAIVDSPFQMYYIILYGSLVIFLFLCSFLMERNVWNIVIVECFYVILFYGFLGYNF